MLRLLLVLSLTTILSAQNNRPVIGILTTSSDYPTYYPPGNWSYFPASYVKFIEQSGARVVPVPYDAPYEKLEYLFNSTNGLLLTGGSADLYVDDPQASSRTMGNVTAAGAYFLYLAKKAYQRGEYYPIWGTCQGMQLMSLVLADNLFLLDNVTGDENVSRNISFTYAAANSKVWSGLDGYLLDVMQTQNVTVYFHHNCISVEGFFRDLMMASENNVLGISYAGYGKSHVASFESKIYPFYGVQFHPEKQGFEWKPACLMSHAPQAVVFEQYIANFFVNEARKSSHQFPNDTALNLSLIYNWNSIPNDLSATAGNCYFFPTVNQSQSSWPGLFM